MTEIITNLNWKVQWSFVFKKTIPFFWYPAHTITFLLPQNFQVLFAAFLGVALGVILSIANLKKK
jgi:ABC-type phosphate/phosphonate transport system permease subunit